MGLFSACTKCCGILVALVAVLVGYILTFEYPMGPVFVGMISLMDMKKPDTEPVPEDASPSPRPVGEKLLSLPSGATMPANGIGMCCRGTAYRQESVRRTVLWYLLQGGRHIDTAAVYMNHVAVGQGIKDAMDRGVPRREIFVTTKVWPDAFGYKTTADKVPQMAKELGLDYIDLVLMHAPRRLHPRLLWNKKFGGEDEFTNYDCKNHRSCRAETWKALSELQQRGLVKDLGVSNFNVAQMEELQQLGLAPIAANQVQYHPWAPKWMQDVVSFCHRHAIVVTAYSSLGGLMAKDKTLNFDPIVDIGKAHGKSAGQVLLRWAIEKNVSVIPGTGNPKHMRQNLDAYSFKLSSEEMTRLDMLAENPIKDNFVFMDF